MAHITVIVFITNIYVGHLKNELGPLILEVRGQVAQLAPGLNMLRYIPVQMYPIPDDLEKFGKLGALLTHAISQHHYRDMHCPKWSRAYQSPSNLFSCPDSGLKFSYCVIKFFQLFFTVQRSQLGIVLSEG